MRFFIPHTKSADTEDAYQQIARSLTEQLRIPIQARRIFSLDYQYSQKPRRAVVGQLEQREGRYEIMAIFAAKPYMIATRAKNGALGMTILVDQNDITSVEDFE